MAGIDKVFGIGLNKTGTTTLGAALRTLGFERHVGHRRGLLVEVREGSYDRLFRVTDSNDCFEDWPFPLVYREMLERYGRRARFVLTMRADPFVWIDSLKRHSLRTGPDNHSRLLAYGYAYPHGVETEHIDFYDRHNAEALAFFREAGAEDQLLRVCWETGDGWPELCRFLGRPIPDAPFPHANSGSGREPGPHLEENLRRVRQQLRLLGREDRMPAEGLSPASAGSG